MFIEIILGVLLSISIIYNIYQVVKISRIKNQLENMNFVLSDIQLGNGNRRILANTGDVTSDLSYKMNEIVNRYEEEISNLKLNNETNKQLMTSLSHDVRTPLTTLIGYLDAIHRGVVVGLEQEEYFQIARLKAYDLKEYIDILFEWFKLQSSELDLLIERVEITELTRFILRDWIPVIEEHNMDFEVSMPDSPVFIDIDQDKYTRIINNLMQNVMNHSQATEIKIKINIKETQVFISIEDNGVGIDEDDLPYIFDRHYKCDRGRSKKGSGLGLAIVKQMVEKMNGKIEVKSEKEEYTKFIMKFLVS